MFEISNSLQQTPWLVFLNILMIVCSCMSLKDALKYPYVVSKRKFVIGCLICLLFCMFSFWGTDWFHYNESFVMVKAGYYSHMEDIYIWIIQSVSPNYLAFRLIVWGIALGLFYRTIKVLSVSKYLALFLFGSIYIIWFAYARVSLAMAIAFWGYALIVKNKHTFISVVLGFAILLSSYFFHKSASFAIAVAFLSLLLRKYPRYAICIVLLAFPIIIICANMGVADFMNSNMDMDSTMGSYMAAGQHYMDKDSTVSGIGAILQKLFERTPYYLTAYLSFMMLSRKNIGIPNDIKAFMMLQILIVIFASIFAFNLGANTDAMYGRFIRFGIIPTPIVLAYLWQSGYRPKTVKLTVYIAIFGTLYALLYSFYNSLI